MAEQKPSPGGEEKELSMELRLLLAFLLMGVVLFLTPYFFPGPEPSPEPPPQKAPASPAEVASNRQQGQPPAAQAASPEQAPQETARIQAEQEQTYTIETDLFRVQFSNRGAVVTSWVLKQYRDSQGNPLELVNREGAAKVGYPFSVELLEPATTPEWNQALFVAEPRQDPPSIEFRFSDGEFFVRKKFTFQRKDYRLQLLSEVLRRGQPVRHLLVWRGGFGDFSFPRAVANQHTLYYDLGQNKLIVHKADAAKNGPLTEQGRHSFAGLEDRYFAAVVLPGSNEIVIRTYSDRLPSPEQKEEPHVGVGLGGAGRLELRMFVGPKDLDLLRQLDPNLAQIVDFGWFAFLAKPLFYVLKWVTEHWVHNYGWSIVVITIAINFLLLPLKITSLKSMRKMQALQPEIRAIQEKYKGLSLRDPRRSRQNEELMELYRKHGVNPMGGCLPLLLQIPFFFAFYKVLTVAIELRGAEWLWVKDLSQPEHLPIRILPVVMVISQFIMQKMTPTTTADPAQQRMMYMMPLVMGFIFYGVSSGLVLYWLTSNLVGIFQQWLFNRMTPAPVLVPAGDKAGASRKHKRGRK